MQVETILPIPEVKSGIEEPINALNLHEPPSVIPCSNIYPECREWYLGKIVMQVPTFLRNPVVDAMDMNEKYSWQREGWYLGDKLKEQLAAKEVPETELLLKIITLLQLEYKILEEQYRKEERCSTQKLSLANDIIARIRHVLDGACNNTVSGHPSRPSFWHSIDRMDD
jgi:hypothetical protein